MQALKLHLGCGKIVLPGWINYDIEKNPGVVVHDLRKPLPHKNATVDFIFSEHFIEHIDKNEAKKMLRDCHRVLKPGGVIRIITPDLQVLLDDYAAGKIDRWAEIWRPSTPCEMINQGMRDWGHQFVYDKRELNLILNESGFKATKYCQYKNSEHSELNGIDQRPHFGEIIKEGVKA